MKITFVLPGFPAPIGGFRIVYEYSDVLVQMGHQVTVLHCCITKESFNSLSWFRRAVRLAGIIKVLFKPKDLSWLNTNSAVQMKYALRLSESKFDDADIVVATAWQTASCVNRLPKSKGKKYYLIQDFAPFMGSEEQLAYTWNLGMKMFATSAWLRDNVRTAAPESNCVHIPIGLPHDTFFKKPEVVNQPLTVAMLYSMGAYKAPEDAIKALEICRKVHPSLEVFVFGKDLPDASLPGWITQLGQISKDDLVMLYNKTGIFVCSSLGEGLGMPAAEAMLCGAAVATTDTGGNREYALDGETALVSKIRDPDALAKNILRLIEDSELRNRLTEAGKRRIEEYTWQRAGRAVEAYFEEVT